MTDFTPKKWDDASVPDAASLGATDKVMGLVGSVVKRFPRSVFDAVYAALVHATRHQHGGADEISTATPGANAIPKANGSGKLDSWVSDADGSTKGLVKLAGDLAGTAALPQVAKIHETGGPTALTIGAIADGQYPKRVGGSLVGVGSPDVTAGKYHPDRHPSGTGITVEDWLSDTASISERWGNQNGASTVIECNSLVIAKTFSGATQRTGRWKTFGTSGNSFTMTMKCELDLYDNFNMGGLMLLTAGSEATPTGIAVIRLVQSSSSDLDVRLATATSYTSGYTDVATLSSSQFRIGAAGMIPIYLQFIYDASPKSLAARISLSGRQWKTIASTTLAAHPTTSHAPFIEPNTGGVTGRIRAEWMVYREDATGIADPWPCGVAA